MDHPNFDDEDLGLNLEDEKDEIKVKSTKHDQSTSAQQAKLSKLQEKQERYLSQQRTNSRSFKGEADETIEETTHTNETLLKMLEDKDKEMQARLKSSDFTAPDDAEVALKKFAEVVKKNRTLMVQFQKQRTLNASQEIIIQKLQEKVKQLESSSATDNDSVSQPKDNSAFDIELQKYKNISSQQKQQLDTLKAQQKALKIALQREVGEELPLSKILSDTQSNTWKGRAEQIALLKAKLEETQKSKPQLSRIDEKHREEIDIRSSERRNELDKLQNLNIQFENDLKTMKMKHDGDQARIKILETEIRNLKAQLKVVLEKTANDDKLVEVLRTELNKLRNVEMKTQTKPKKEYHGAPAEQLIETPQLLNTHIVEQKPISEETANTVTVTKTRIPQLQFNQPTTENQTETKRMTRKERMLLKEQNLLRSLATNEDKTVYLSEEKIAKKE